MLAQYLEEVKALGEKEAPVKAVLAGRTPQQAAEEFVKSSKLQGRGGTEAAGGGSRTAAAKSDDGMMRLARLLEEPARKLLKKHEEAIEITGDLGGRADRAVPLQDLWRQGVSRRDLHAAGDVRGREGVSG